MSNVGELQLNSIQIRETLDLHMVNEVLNSLHTDREEHMVHTRYGAKLQVPGAPPFAINDVAFHSYCLGISGIPLCC